MGEDERPCFDRVFENDEALRGGISELLRTRQQDVCFSILGAPGCDGASVALVAHVLGQLLGTGHLQHSVSFLLVKGASDGVRDLFSGGGAATSVTGVKVTTATQVQDLLQRFAPDSVADGECLVLSISRVIGTSKTRVHITFDGEGVWEQALQRAAGLLSKLAGGSQCVRIICNGMQNDEAKEWRRLFPLTRMPSSQQKPGKENALEVALARIRELEEELAEANKRIQLREHTLVNVLIGSHPAFQDLADYPRRKTAEGAADAKENKVNRVEFHSSVVDNTAMTPLLPSSSKKPALTRSLSIASAGGGAVRVARMPSIPAPAPVSKHAAKERPVKTPGPGRAGVTPGTSKTKSRVF